MNTFAPQADTTARYAKCIDASKRVRWEIERDVIRDRRFDLSRKFLPDALSLVARLPFLDADEARWISQVQGRSYANMFALVERYIGAQVLRLTGRHQLGDQVALEALVRQTDEEIKHQALFRRLDAIAAAQMPAGYRFLAEPDAVASAVLTHSTWAVLALTLHIELFTLAHYRASIGDDDGLCPLWKDVFRFHWMEESQHAIVDEIEWRAEHARLSPAEQERGVDHLIALVGAVDGIVRQQAAADADHALAHLPRTLSAAQEREVRRAFVAAYRWQYIGSGVQEPRFAQTLAELTTAAQRERLGAALAPILADGGVA